MKSIQNVKFLNLIDKYKLPKNKTLIFGSAVLALHGIRENKDLDVMVTEDIFKKLAYNGLFIEGVASTSKEKYYHTKNEKLEVYSSLGRIRTSVDKLIDKADKIDGYLFLSLEDIKKWKKAMGREKDLEDLKLLGEMMVCRYLEDVQK
jgi:hypothetical protein